MSLITRMRKQKAVYWSRLKDVNNQPLSDKFGQPAYNDPVEVDCRWDDKQEHLLTPAGTTIDSVATVYPSVVPIVGDLLWKGLLSEATNQQLVPGSPGVFEIKIAEIIPDRKAKENLHIARL